MKSIKLSITDLEWYFFFCGSILLPPILGVAHYLLTAFILLMTMRKTKTTIKIEKLLLLLWIGIFASYVAISKMWAASSTDNQKSIIIALFEAVIVFYCILKYINDEERVHKFMLIFSNCMIVLALVYYFTSPISTWGTEGMGKWLNIWRNAAGYYFGFAAIMMAYIYFYVNKSKSFLWRALILIIASLGTGSRKVVLLYLVAVVIYCLMQPGFYKRLKYIVGGIILGGVVVFICFQIPVFREVYAERILLLFQGSESSDSSTVVRTLMLGYAFDLFLEKPIWGNGIEGFYIWMGNQTSFLDRWAMSATYSHCNYTELLANFGLVGFILYYCVPILQVIKGIKMRQSSLVQLGVVIIGTYIVLDVGTVSYYFKYCLYILLIGILCVKAGTKAKKGIDNGQKH